MVKCETIDVEVPADAQIILECEIHPTERELEAPFGEYPGTYGPERNNPVVYVKAITMRKDALYQSSFVGHRDNLFLSGITRNSVIYKTCRLASAAVVEVYVPPAGRNRYICYVRMSKVIEGDPKNAAMAAFTADPFLKYVVVVDEDVDITNDTDVWHAIATRVRWDHDAFVVTYSRGSPLELRASTIWMRRSISRTLSRYRSIRCRSCAPTSRFRWATSRATQSRMLAWVRRRRARSSSVPPAPKSRSNAARGLRIIGSGVDGDDQLIESV